jgi:preprotein translocase subunit SecF
VEILLNANYDFLGKKKILLGISAVLVAVSLISIFTKGIPLGVDFRGGTLVYVKFTERPNEDEIRNAMSAAGLGGARIQRYGPVDNNEVIISLDQQANEQSLDAGRNAIINALRRDVPAGKKDLNEAGVGDVESYLRERNPLQLGGDGARERYAALARAILDARDRAHGGVLASLDQFSSVVPPPVLESLKAGFYTSNFAVRNVEIVGPQVGKQLQRQAILATLYALAGMLIYIAFRFEWVYGAAAVIAVFHDTLITVGAFSLTGKEISLTVIAAILTLIGYSMNDTIVIFDRVRENLKLMRREPLETIVNTSVNQTLSRTILTSGLTFIAVLSLYLFGGEVLHGFSFALVVGILIGGYSTLAVAAPILVLYQQWRASRGGRGSIAVSADPGRREKARVKA